MMEITEGVSLDFPNYEVFDTNTEYRKMLRMLKSVTVRHRQTCTCGRTLVNTYYRDPGPTGSVQDRIESWKCKKCWDKYDAIDEKLKELIEEEV